MKKLSLLLALLLSLACLLCACQDPPGGTDESTAPSTTEAPAVKNQITAKREEVDGGVKISFYVEGEVAFAALQGRVLIPTGWAASDITVGSGGTYEEKDGALQLALVSPTGKNISEKTRLLTLTLKPEPSAAAANVRLEIAEILDQEFRPADHITDKASVAVSR